MRVVRLAIAIAMFGCGNVRPTDGPHDANLPDAVIVPDAEPVFGSAQLAAMWPPLARTGQTVLLEGTFTGHPAVTLPGGATAVATVLGDHRARIVVPPNATVGDATGTGGGATGGHVLFHAITYTPGLRPFEPYEQADGAHTEVWPLQRLMSPGAVVVGDAYYVIGGYSEADHAFESQVEVAPIHADGTLGALTISPDVALVTGRNEFSTVVIDSYLYVIGGSDGELLATIERAPIRTDGTLGAFEVLPDQLTQPRSGATATVVGDYLYVIGGYSAMSSIERARIEPDGTLDPFELQGLQLAEGRTEANAIVSGDHLYVYGGAGDGDAMPDAGVTYFSWPTAVEAATIDADGSLEPFAIVPDVSLSVGRSTFASASIGDGLYLFGGYNPMQTPSNVERAPIQPDGTLGNFGPTGVTVSSSGVAAAVAGNDVYVVGGNDWQPVLHASIDVSDAIGFSTESASVLDTAVSSSSLVTTGSTVYLVGGKTASGGFSSEVQASPLTDGLVGSFTPSASSLVTARADAGTLTAGSNVYVIGGDTAGGVVGSIERATIGADGTLGAFAIDPDAMLVTPRSQFATTVIDRNAGEFVLVMGGLAADGSTLDTIEQAPINPDGTLGAFVQVGHMAVARRGAAAYVTTGDAWEYVLLIGGYDGIGARRDIERGMVDRSFANAFATVIVPQTQLTTARTGSSVAVLGDHVYVFGGDTGAGPLDSIELATFTGDLQFPMTNFTTVSTMAEPRSNARCTTIANQVYCFGGEGASGALQSIETAQLQ